MRWWSRLLDSAPLIFVAVGLVGVVALMIGNNQAAGEYAARCRDLGGVPVIGSHSGWQCFKPAGERIDVWKKS